MNARTRSRHRGVVALAWLVSLLVVAGLAWWAGSATMGRPNVESTDDAPVLVDVVEGTLGRNITVSVQADWELTPLALTSGEGTVTTLDIAGAAEVKAGDTMLSINLRPVIVAQGAIPSFRDLAQGMSGTDVTQLQQFLAGLGLYKGKVDGSFNAATTSAVKVWQKSLGLEQSGMVFSTDIVYLPTLPARVILADGIRVGARISMGSELVYAVAPQPQFTAIFDSAQMPTVASATTLTIEAGEGQWTSVMGESKIDQQTGAVFVALSGTDGGSVCGDACVAQIPVNPDGTAVFLTGHVEIVPTTSGAMVPSAAIVTDASGQALVELADGTQVPIEVLVAQDGQSIVTGIDVGETVKATPGS